MARVRWAQRSGLRSSVKIPGGEAIRALLFPPGKRAIPGQVKFLSHFDNRECKYVAYRGGIGSGKSWIGSHYAIEKAARNPSVRGFVGANTYPQLWQSTLTGLYEVCAAYGVPLHPATPEAHHRSGLSAACACSSATAGNSAAARATGEATTATIIRAGSERPGEQ